MAGRGRGALTAVAAAALAVPAGCTPSRPAVTTSAPAPVTTSPVSASAAPAPPVRAPRTAPWIDLQPGDCLAAPPPTDPAEVTVTIVDCATPHSAETFLRAELPVDAAVTGTANAQCEAGVAPYTGTPLPASGYVISYLIDSEQDRTSNNPYPSTVICLLQNGQGQPLTGPARR